MTTGLRWNRLWCRRNVAWTRCSLLELKHLNIELNKQNQEQQEELERKILDETRSAKELAATQKKICALEERVHDVRYQDIFNYPKQF